MSRIFAYEIFSVVSDLEFAISEHLCYFNYIKVYIQVSLLLVYSMFLCVLNRFQFVFILSHTSQLHLIFKHFPSARAILVLFIPFPLLKCPTVVATCI